ncbi:hypothetical protein [Nocardioides sp. GY 10127]|uniref:hypothetical protein n=1 Tax=Nocardioides sp. GY 10127 TaxID=2569762 RepID=UPI0010A7B612|nr:hypothetical protein [Nocardioides sp. GY 10127]TIC78796.1 hypothetical protein E8D37_19055 [Nocardioides sp. GY 10127]
MSAWTEATAARRDCATCPSRDVSEHHHEACARRVRAIDEAQALGRAQGIPEVTTADLWAHLGHVAVAPEDATRVIRQVIDLGWRPVVGKDRTRLWPAPTTTEPEEGTP